MPSRLEDGRQRAPHPHGCTRSCQRHHWFWRLLLPPRARSLHPCILNLAVATTIDDGASPPREHWTRRRDRTQLLNALCTLQHLLCPRPWTPIRILGKSLLWICLPQHASQGSRHNSSLSCSPLLPILRWTRLAPRQLRRHGKNACLPHNSPNWYRRLHPTHHELGVGQEQWCTPCSWRTTRRSLPHPSAFSCLIQDCDQHNLHLDDGPQSTHLCPRIAKLQTSSPHHPNPTSNSGKKITYAREPVPSGAVSAKLLMDNLQEQSNPMVSWSLTQPRHRDGWHDWFQKWHPCCLWNVSIMWTPYSATWTPFDPIEFRDPHRPHTISIDWDFGTRGCLIQTFSSMCNFYP